MEQRWIIFLQRFSRQSKALTLVVVVVSFPLNVQHPPGWCAAAIFQQNTHHTPAEVEGKRTMFFANWIRGWLGGRFREPGHKGSPYSVKSVMESLMTTVNQDLGLMSFKRWHLLQHSAPIAALGHWGYFDRFHWSAIVLSQLLGARVASVDQF